MAGTQKKSAVRKRQTENQLAGRRGELVASFCFPDEWVVRPLPHDFGLDLEVEPFYEAEGDPDGRQRYETRGEHLYVQVKAVESIVFTEPQTPGITKVPAYRLSISTSELLLAEEMGASVPILLLLVHPPSQSIYFVCLTDYVAKVLDSSTPNWRKQQTASVWVPKSNKLNTTPLENSVAPHVEYFQQLARRAKYFTLFNFLWLAKAEVDNALDFVDRVIPQVDYFRQLIANFHRVVSIELQQLRRLDLWQLSGNPPAFGTAAALIKDIFDAYDYTDAELSAEHLHSLSQEDLEVFVDRYRETAFAVAGWTDQAAKIGASFESDLRSAYLPRKVSELVR